MIALEWLNSLEGRRWKMQVWNQGSFGGGLSLGLTFIGSGLDIALARVFAVRTRYRGPSTALFRLG